MTLDSDTADNHVAPRAQGPDESTKGQYRSSQRRIRTVLGILLSVLIVAGVVVWVRSSMVGAEKEQMFDIVVRNGTVFDGSGSSGTATDVGIRDGRIIALGDLSKSKADRVIDAHGKYVTPGFIDVHAHTDLAVLGDAKSSLSQGVTTEAIGPDGSGRFDTATELEELDAQDKGINVAPYLGFNSVWREVVGEADIRPTDEQSREMQELIAQGLQDGAWGVASGLGYFPARYSTTDEVSKAIGDARKWRTLFSDHMRDETNLVVEGVEENIAIGRATGLMAEATHMKVAGPKNWGKSAELLELQAAARAEGLLAGGDVYPYTAASTGLEFYVPGWAQDGGTEAMLARFADPSMRSKIDEEVTSFVKDDVGEPSNIAFPVLENRTLADLMSEYGGVTIGEAVIRTLEDHDGGIPCVMQIGSEDDLETFLADPYLAISSDGGVTDSSETHPRAYGTYPRVLGRYVREREVLSWEEAIRKMTSLPAGMLGMTDRGLIGPGMAADVVVFDPETIIDRATFEKPKQYSEGVEIVVVNGEIAYEEGEATLANAGQALRREGASPTRIETVSLESQRSSEFEVVDRSSKERLHLNLVLEPGAASAGGHLAVRTQGGDAEFESTEVGVRQFDGGWSSVAGVGRTADGNEDVSFLLIVDDANPDAAPGETTVALRIGEQWVYEGLVATSAEAPEAP